MRAVELRIVFEDDDGKTYVQTFAPPNAAVLNAVAAAMQMGSEEPPIVGPVLRKVSEVEGAVEHDGDAWFVVDGRNGPGVGIENVVPEHLPLSEGPRSARTFRLLFDVTAVPVPEVKP